MSLIKKLIAVLSDEQLIQAFGEIQKWKTTNILPDGVVRTTHDQLEEQLGEEMDLRITEQSILFEMACRFADEFQKRQREALSAFPALLNPFLGLQEKYLARGLDGEIIGFNDEKLTEHNCSEIHSDLVELFETGRYYTSNELILTQLKLFLVKEQIPYQVKDSSVGHKFMLTIKE